MQARECTDQVVGNILSGWRYDISSLSPAMRTDYELHLEECSHCRHRMQKARSIDVLVLSVSALSMVAFLLMAVVMNRLEAIVHISNPHVQLHQTAVTISLQAVAMVGLIVSMVLCVLVSIATPVPGLLTELWQERVPEDVRERFTRHA